MTRGTEVTADAAAATESFPISLIGRSALCFVFLLLFLFLLFIIIVIIIIVVIPEPRVRKGSVYNAAACVQRGSVYLSVVVVGHADGARVGESAFGPWCGASR